MNNGVNVKLPRKNNGCGKRNVKEKIGVGVVGQLSTEL